MAGAVARTPAMVGRERLGPGLAEEGSATFRRSLYVVEDVAQGEPYSGVVSSFGVLTRDAGNRALAQSTLAGSLEARRQDVAGANIDEEIVRLIEPQTACSAAARLVPVAGDMPRELINLGR